jgi:hypothetical protein
MHAMGSALFTGARGADVLTMQCVATCSKPDPVEWPAAWKCWGASVHMHGHWLAKGYGQLRQLFQSARWSGGWCLRPQGLACTAVICVCVFGGLACVPGAHVGIHLRALLSGSSLYS